MKTENVDRLINIIDVSEMLSLSVSTIKRMDSEGDFVASYKIKGRKVYSLVDIQNYIKKIKQKG